jgi:hypothetical protein
MWTIGMIPRTGDQPCHYIDTYTGQIKHWRNADRYPCLELDSNPRSQYLSVRKLFVF